MKTLDVVIVRKSGAEEKVTAVIGDDGKVEFMDGIKLEQGDTWSFSLSAVDTIAWLGLPAPTMHVGPDYIARICTNCGEPFVEDTISGMALCPDCGKAEA